MKTNKETIAAAVIDARVHDLASALNAHGVKARVTLGIAARQVRIDAYGIVWPISSGFAVRDLDGVDHALSADELTSDLVDLVDMADEID